MVSKYLILILVNMPLIVAGIIGSTAAYKTKILSRRDYIGRLVAWCVLFLLLIAIEPIYNTLIRFNLTNSSPMSIFDLALLTLSLWCLFFLKRVNESLTRLNRKLSRLHENLAIAEEQRHWDRDSVE